jgi:hypothetical protein
MKCSQVFLTPDQESWRDDPRQLSGVFVGEQPIEHVAPESRRQLQALGNNPFEEHCDACRAHVRRMARRDDDSRSRRVTERADDSGRVIPRHQVMTFGNVTVPRLSGPVSQAFETAR